MKKTGADIIRGLAASLRYVANVANRAVHESHGSRVGELSLIETRVLLVEAFSHVHDEGKAQWLEEVDRRINGGHLAWLSVNVMYVLDGIEMSQIERPNMEMIRDLCIQIADRLAALEESIRDEAKSEGQGVVWRLLDS